MPRTVTLTSPVPSLRGRTITTTHSPDTIGSPWLSFAMPGSVFSVGNSAASNPPESSASDPFRSTSTFFALPLLTKARFEARDECHQEDGRGHGECDAQSGHEREPLAEP